MNNRRKILLAMLACATLTASAFADEKSPSLGGGPFTQIPKVAFGEGKIIYLFQFGCEFCAEYHSLVSGWKATLPPEAQFAWVPAVFDPDTQAMGLAYMAAVKAAHGGSIEPFMRASYSAVQSGRMDVRSVAAWSKIAASAGITGFDAAYKNLPPKLGYELVKLTHDLNLQATPTMVVDGQYLLTPDNTDGDKQQFVGIANALVSKMLRP